MAKNILVLFSGGADSLLMAEWAISHRKDSKVTLLSFLYGQNHHEEIKYATKQSVKFSGDSGWPKHYIKDISSIFKGLNSNLLDPGSANYPGVHTMHVPGRNAIFLSIAMSVAEQNGDDEIWIGCDFSDRENLFPDCYQEWIIRMNAVANINGSRPLKIKAPLLGWTKEDVIEELDILGHKIQDIYSGYATPEATVDNT